MFRYNISEKMRILAYVNFIVGLIISAAIIIICIKNGADASKYRIGIGRDDSSMLIWMGIIGGGLSVFATVIVSFVIAAIGDISESLEEMVRFHDSENSMISSMTSWTCGKCGTVNPGNKIVCSKCREYKN
ncbi:MAG: hypothetical protein EGR80_09605 [Ruminiclostridium sp.]|nr:hypothetical protein [Ruminiclostridium sp.]